MIFTNLKFNLQNPHFAAEYSKEEATADSAEIALDSTAYLPSM